MNRLLAQAFCKATCPDQPTTAGFVKFAPTRQAVDGIVREAPLRQLMPHEKAVRQQQEADALGGMRNPAKSVPKVLGLQSVGSKIRAIVDDFCQDHPESISAALSQIGKGGAQGLPALDDLKERLETEFEARKVSAAEAGCMTRLNQKLIRALARAAQDPDVMAADKLAFGAPAGIQKPVEDPGGVFPAADSRADEEPCDSKELTEDEQGFFNYMSVENDPLCGRTH